MFINSSQPIPGFIPLAGFNASMFKYNLDISDTGMFALQLYAFGGLAFMIGVILFALGLWFRTVVIKREWANSPPDLELHPEVSKLCFSFLFLFTIFISNVIIILAYEKKGDCSGRTT
jgi:hypothetical protein